MQAFAKEGFMSLTRWGCLAGGLAILSLMLVAGCSQKSPAPVAAGAGGEGGKRGGGGQQMVKVSIDNFSYSPAEVTVAAGSTVVWTNRDDVPHTVTASDKRQFTSPALDTDETFSRRFDQSGTYEYFCAVHPHMTGRIVVK
jgi:plastocyanin